MYRAFVLLPAVAVCVLGVRAIAAETDRDIPPKWSGTWQAAGSTDGKELRCVIRSVADGKWEATFTGVCNRRFSFNVKMLGRAVDKPGDKPTIHFTGKTDLGEANGGLYHWTGDLRPGKFTGKYKSTGGKEGTFELKPAKTVTIGGTLGRVLIVQREVHDGTVRIDKLVEKQRGQNFDIEAARLKKKQLHIAGDVEKLILILRRDMTAVVLLQAIEGVRDDMKQVGHRLAHKKVGKLTQAIEADIIEALEQILAIVR